MTVAELSLRIGTRRLPVVLPSIRDARLHTAAVILTVHAIGITALGFRISVPQIVAAILTAAVVDVAFTVRLTGKLVWPASGMLTGSGVALILRLVDMDAGRYWDWSGWHLYALVAGMSVATKYVLRWRGSHLFNPSNIGLVAVFLLLGSDVVEPLDFWWAPLDGWMALGYLVILGGGIVITRRLALLEMAVIFWTVLAAGLGVLAVSGHCMIATWSPDPVCDGRFWSVLVTSPEVLVFLFFMITDPKTIPAGRLARMLFAAVLAVLATVLIAPQGLEFGAKVALLASLVILSPVRAIFDRVVASFAVPTAPRAAFLGGAGIGAALVVVAAGIVLAGVPARGPAARPVPIAVEVAIEEADLPEMTVSPDVEAVNAEIQPQALAVTLAENLAIEARAVREGDSALLASSSTGERLTEVQRQLGDGVSNGRRAVSEYQFETLHLEVARTAEGQSSTALAVEAAGTRSDVVYDAAGTELSRSATPFTATFVLRRAGSDRWLIASQES